MITSANPKCVLIIEPEIIIRMVVAHYLRDCGFLVIEGVQAADFQTLIESGNRPDVVLADAHLSGDINGFALSHAIRQTHPNIDVILTSGVAGAAERAHDLCDDGPIQKPYHPKDVETRIRMMLERRRSSQRN